ncbi:MAG: hypothetical protein JSR71_13665 [Proteobacteria bacterium]|nr:hypothetical protein [Pseudomonadota bacterium]
MKVGEDEESNQLFIGSTGTVVRLVFEQQKERGPQWPTIKSTVSKIGCTVCLIEPLRTQSTRKIL